MSSPTFRFVLKQPPFRTACGCLLAAVFQAFAATAAPENLLRNGSFEGGMLYWHNLGTNDYALVRGGAAAGDFLVVLTLQKDSPPTVLAHHGVAKVGGRTATFDGRKLTVD